ncbi:MAG: hypothetical protein PHU94_04970 [Bacilli bacterium]|nr:hypothetical protein [Bacilli bacterium]
MKKSFKENKLFFIVFVVLLLGAIYVAIKYGIEHLRFVSDYKKIIKLYPEKADWDMKMNDAFTIYGLAITEMPFVLLLPLSSLVILLASTYGIYNYFNSGMWKNTLIRSDYKKEIRKQIFKTYLYSLVLPLFIIVFLIILSIVTGNINVINTLKTNPDVMAIGSEHFSTWPTFFLFIFIYLFDIALWGIFYVNIFLIYLRKNLPYLILILLSYLTIVGIGIIAEALVGAFLYYKCGYSVEIYYSLSLFSSLTLTQVYGMWTYFIYGFAYFFVSSLIVYLMYRDKKKVVIRNEN